MFKQKIISCHLSSSFVRNHIIQVFYKGCGFLLSVEMSETQVYPGVYKCIL